MLGYDDYYSFADAGLVGGEPSTVNGCSCASVPDRNIMKIKQLSSPSETFDVEFPRDRADVVGFGELRRSPLHRCRIPRLIRKPKSSVRTPAGRAGGHNMPLFLEWGEGEVCGKTGMTTMDVLP